MNDNSTAEQGQIAKLRDELSNMGILRRYGVEIPEDDFLIIE